MGGRPGCRACAWVRIWSARSGMVALIPRRRRPERIGAAGVGLIAQYPAGPGPRAAMAPTSDRQLVHQRDEGQGVMALPAAGHPGQRPAAGVSEQVNLGAQPAPGAAQRLPVLVIRLSP